MRSRSRTPAARPEGDRARSAATTLAGPATAVLAHRLGRGRSPAPTVVLAALGAATAGALAWHARRRTRSRYAKRQRDPIRAQPPPRDQGLDIPGLSPLFTPNDRFYITDVSLRPPVVDPVRWRLRVGGMVERPFELTLAELAEEASTELDATLACVHNPVGGPRIGTARWVGVPAADLLERAGVEMGATSSSLARSTASPPASRSSSSTEATLRSSSWR